MNNNTFTAQEIIKDLKQGFSKSAIADKFQLTNSEVALVEQDHFSVEHVRMQKEDVINAVFQRLISQYEEDISYLTKLQNDIPRFAFDDKLAVVNIKNSLRNALFKVLKDCGFTPQQINKREISGWEALMQSFAASKTSAKVTLTQQVEIEPHITGEDYLDVETDIDILQEAM